MSDCISGPTQVIGCVVGGVGGKIASSGMDELAKAMFELFGKSLKFLATFWTSTPSPDLGSNNPILAEIQQWTAPLEAGALVVGLMVAGLRLMWNARINDDGAMRQVAKGIALGVVVAGAGGLLLGTLIAGCDQWAQHILDHGVNDVAVGKRMAQLAAASSGVPVLGSALASVLYLGAGVASLAQAALMLMRAPITILLVGVWGVAAVSAVTKTGSDWFKRLTSWLISWAMYKLVAVLVYATAFAFIGESTDFRGVLSGLLLLCVAILALPSLMRLVTPSVAAISNGGGTLAGGAAALAGTGGALAMQASGSRGSGAGGAAGPPQTHSIGPAQPFSAGATGSAGNGSAGSSPTGPGGSAGGSAGSGSGGGNGQSGSAGSGASGSSGSGTAGAGASRSGATGAGAGAGGGAAAAAGVPGAAAQLGQAAGQAANAATGSSGTAEGTTP
ncbi:MAG: hypothetical protein ABI140_04360 [Jatrophihabitantaceae bacterium]